MDEYDILLVEDHRARVLAWAGAAGGILSMSLLVVGSCCYYLPALVAFPLAVLSLMASLGALTMSSGRGTAGSVAILGSIISAIATLFGLVFGCVLIVVVGYISVLFGLSTL